jgi:hypothetical protein
MLRNNLDRAAAVSQLLTHALQSIGAPGESDWLRLILRRGFVGFERMTDAQLLRELELRELLPPPLEVEGDADEDMIAEDRWSQAALPGARRADLSEHESGFE